MRYRLSGEEAGQDVLTGIIPPDRGQSIERVKKENLTTIFLSEQKARNLPR
jgi:hypothetical protein